MDDDTPALVTFEVSVRVNSISCHSHAHCSSK